eukprot:TRINITY_DN69946_c0_g1_i1.p1 TRINITY_DN69946_c0_g1~~TRINITY_DN69946_c0_g1_i1.p1  ORF type:complete len:147 (+),score=18.73 TRINITY_DN69946_c0_g1_i1:40-441(+)
MGIPLCLVLHANGLCKDVWKPFVEDLANLMGVEATSFVAFKLGERPGFSCFRLGQSLHLALADLLGHGAAPQMELRGEDTDWTQLGDYLDELLTDCLRALPEPPSEILAVGTRLVAAQPYWLRCAKVLPDLTE